jgi:hypothetical protein
VHSCSKFREVFAVGLELDLLGKTMIQMLVGEICCYVIKEALAFEENVIGL